MVIAVKTWIPSFIPLNIHWINEIFKISTKLQDQQTHNCYNGNICNNEKQLQVQTFLVFLKLLIIPILDISVPRNCLILINCIKRTLSLSLSTVCYSSLFIHVWSYKYSIYRNEACYDAYYDSFPILHKHFIHIVPINFLFTHDGEVEALCDAIDCQQQDIQTVPPQ